MVFDYVGPWGYWAFAAMITLLALSVAAAMAPWKLLASTPQYLHAFCLSALALGLFWRLDVEVQGLVSFHPLLMMVAVMVFGGALGIWVGALALGVGWLLGSQPLLSLMVPMACNVVAPVLAALSVLKVIERLAVKNLFVYMLGGGFFGAMLSVQVMALANWCYVHAFGPAPLMVIASDYYYVSLLMMFPEGFINGALITTLTVLKPDLVKTYNDRHYLDGE